MPESSIAIGSSCSTTIDRRSIVFSGKKTSVSLEDEFWNALKEIADKRGVHISHLVAAIEGRREHANLSSEGFISQLLPWF
jgi:predicted DNA-binding ribbon-helix-helix protein